VPKTDRVNPNSIQYNENVNRPIWIGPQVSGNVKTNPSAAKIKPGVRKEFGAVRQHHFKV